MSASQIGANPIDTPLRFICADSPGDPLFQIALEEAILRELNEGKGEPTLRLWRCERAIVMGVSRRVGEDVRIEAVEQDGVPLVRRSSGGGTVYHHPDNLCYSLFLPYAWRELRPRERITDSIQLLCGIVVKSLQKAGITAETTSRGDIITEGRKVSGTAQQRVRNAMCHHGTFLLDAHTDEIERYLGVLQGQARPHREHVAGLREFGIGASRQQLAGWIRGSTAEVLGVELRDDRLKSEEVARARELVREKYSREEWTRRFS